MLHLLTLVPLLAHLLLLEEGGEGAGEGEGAGGQTPSSQFTQADVDRIVQERLARERGKFADYDDLKTKADQFDQLQQQNQSELERAQTRAAELERERDQERQARTVAERRSAVLSAATGPIKVGDEEKRFANPSIALRLISDEVDHNDAEAVQTALADLLRTEPYLAGQQASSTPSPDPGQGPRPGKQDKSVSAARERHRRDREAAKQQQSDPFAGMNVVGGR